MTINSLNENLHPPTSFDDMIYLCFQKDLIVLRETQTAFQMDSLNSSHPLSFQENYIQTSSQITELFDDITYSKVGIKTFLMLIS